MTTHQIPQHLAIARIDHDLAVMTGARPGDNELAQQAAADLNLPIPLVLQLPDDLTGVIGGGQDSRRRRRQDQRQHEKPNDPTD